MNFGDCYTEACKKFRPIITRQELHDLFVPLFSIFPGDEYKSRAEMLQKKLRDYGVLKVPLKDPNMMLSNRQYQGIDDIIKCRSYIKSEITYSTKLAKQTLPNVPISTRVDDPMVINLVTLLIDDLSSVTMSSQASSAILNFECFVLGATLDHPEISTMILPVESVLQNAGWSFGNDDSHHGFQGPPDTTSLIRNLCSLIGKSPPSVSQTVHEVSGNSVFEQRKSGTLVSIDVEDANHQAEEHLSVSDWISVLVGRLEENENPTIVIREFVEQTNFFDDPTFKTVLECLAVYGWDTNGQKFEGSVEKLVYALRH